MSLVHEALERAKREAAARTTREIGLPERPLASQPYRASRGKRGLVAALAVAGFALALTVGYLLASHRAEPVAAIPHPSLSSAIAPIVRPEPLAPLPLGPTSAAGAPSATESAAVDPAAIVPAAGPPSAPRPTLVQSFVRELRLPGGTVIHLGGIAWSEVAPLAYLNGKLLGVGESVAGQTIERIEKESVVLVGGEERRILKLR